MEKSHFEELLNKFEFDVLEEQLLKMPFNEMEGILDELAYNRETYENNLLIYAFLRTMIAKNETYKLHLLTSRIMGFTLNHVGGSELIGLYHGLRAAELDPENAGISEYLLIFNHMPEKLLNDEMAINFARKVIKENPNSLAAKMTLSKAKS